MKFRPEALDPTRVGAFSSALAVHAHLSRAAHLVIGYTGHEQLTAARALRSQCDANSIIVSAFHRRNRRR